MTLENAHEIVVAVRCDEPPGIRPASREPLRHARSGDRVEFVAGHAPCVVEWLEPVR